MKLAIGFLLLCTAGSVFAESAFLQDLTKLTEQRDQALSAAAEPINRRYKDSLEILLRHAMQANDLDAAIKIREVMGQPASAPAATGAPAPAAAVELDKVALTKLGLERALDGTKWVTDTNNWLHAIHFAKGRATVNPDKDGKGRNPPYKALDGSTISIPWNGHEMTITVSSDLKSAAIGSVAYHRDKN